DTPGGAATSGFYAVLLGIGFLLSARTGPQTAAAIGSMTIGLVCLYLSQVRAMMVVTLVCVLAVAGVLTARGERRKIAGLGFIVGLLVIVSFKSALSLAQGSVSARVSSLTSGSAGEVYYSNRGKFLEYTFTELVPQYPLGAGMGRWGMMYAYFGANPDPASGPLWAEIQWTGWLYDGGLPLMLAY